MRSGVTQLVSQSGHFAALEALYEAIDELFPSFASLDPDAPRKITAFFEKLNTEELNKYDHWKSLVEKGKAGSLTPWEFLDATENVTCASLKTDGTALRFAKTTYLPYAEKLADSAFNTTRTIHLHRHAREQKILADCNTPNMAVWCFLKYIRHQLFLSWQRFITQTIIPLGSTDADRATIKIDTSTLTHLKAVLCILENLDSPDTSKLMQQNGIEAALTKIREVVGNENFDDDNQYTTLITLTKLIPALKKCIRHIEQDTTRAEKLKETSIDLFHPTSAKTTLEFKPHTGPSAEEVNRLRYYSKLVLANPIRASSTDEDGLAGALRKRAQTWSSGSS